MVGLCAAKSNTRLGPVGAHSNSWLIKSNTETNTAGTPFLLLCLFFAFATVAGVWSLGVICGAVCRSNSALQGSGSSCTGTTQPSRLFTTVQILSSFSRSTGVHANDITGGKADSTRPRCRWCTNAGACRAAPEHTHRRSLPVAQEVVVGGAARGQQHPLVAMFPPTTP